MGVRGLVRVSFRDGRTPGLSSQLTLLLLKWLCRRIKKAGIGTLSDGLRRRDEANRNGRSARPANHRSCAVVSVATADDVENGNVNAASRRGRSTAARTIVNFVDEALQESIHCHEAATREAAAGRGVQDRNGHDRIAGRDQISVLRAALRGDFHWVIWPRARV